MHLILWLLCGLIGGVLVWYADPDGTRDHISLDHVCFGLLLAIAGVSALIAGCIIWLVERGDDIVLWRRKP